MHAGVSSIFKLWNLIGKKRARHLVRSLRFSAPRRCEAGSRERKHAFADRRRTEMG